MEIERFEGQAVFLEEYYRIAKEDKKDEEIVADVLEQLNQQLTETTLLYILPSEKTKDGQEQIFPFTKKMFSEDLNASISTRFIYEGAAYVYEREEDEQL